MAYSTFDRGQSHIIKLGKEAGLSMEELAHTADAELKKKLEDTQVLFENSIRALQSAQKVFDDLPCEKTPQPVKNEELRNYVGCVNLVDTHPASAASINKILNNEQGLKEHKKPVEAFYEGSGLETLDDPSFALQDKWGISSFLGHYVPFPNKPHVADMVYNMELVFSVPTEVKHESAFIDGKHIIGIKETILEHIKRITKGHKVLRNQGALHIVPLKITQLFESTNALCPFSKQIRSTVSIENPKHKDKIAFGGNHWIKENVVCKNKTVASVVHPRHTSEQHKVLYDSRELLRSFPGRQWMTVPGHQYDHDKHEFIKDTTHIKDKSDCKVVFVSFPVPNGNQEVETKNVFHYLLLTRPYELWANTMTWLRRHIPESLGRMTHEVSLENNKKVRLGAATKHDPDAATPLWGLWVPMDVLSQFYVDTLIPSHEHLSLYDLVQPSQSCMAVDRLELVLEEIHEGEYKKVCGAKSAKLLCDSHFEYTLHLSVDFELFESTSVYVEDPEKAGKRPLATTINEDEQQKIKEELGVQIDKIGVPKDVFQEPEDTAAPPGGMRSRQSRPRSLSRYREEDAPENELCQSALNELKSRMEPDEFDQWKIRTSRNRLMPSDDYELAEFDEYSRNGEGGCSIRRRRAPESGSSGCSVRSRAEPRSGASGCSVRPRAQARPGASSGWHIPKEDLDHRRRDRFHRLD